MNETIKTIINRRSIRAYKQDQISDAELDIVLEAAQYAPSGMNQQPWHFSVIQNKELLEKINAAAKIIYANSGIKYMEDRAKSENFQCLYSAPTLIIVSADPKGPTPQEDCTLALGNILLAAASLGLGACWIHALTHLHKSEDGQLLLKQLAVPEGYAVYGSAAIGYKAAEPSSAPPRKEGIISIVK